MSAAASSNTYGAKHLHHIASFCITIQRLFELEIMQRQLEATADIMAVLPPSLSHPFSWLCNRIQLLSYSHIITFHPQGLTVSLVWQKKPNYSLTLTLSLSLSVLLNNQSASLTSILQHLFKRVNPGHTNSMSAFAPSARRGASTVAQTLTYKHMKWFHSTSRVRISRSNHPHHIGF